MLAFIPVFLTLLAYGFLLWAVYKIVMTLLKISTTLDEIKTTLQSNSGRSTEPQ